MDFVANWSYPTEIRFGVGRIKELSNVCNSIGIIKPLLVTDKGLAQLDTTSEIIENLKINNLFAGLFCDLDSNPNEYHLKEGIEFLKQRNNDGVIALGGGSALDLGKLIAFMAYQSRPVWDFEDISDWWTRANTDKILPIVAVPTTSGTGSEVGRASVITNTQTQQKKIIFHPKILPIVVISDPELTLAKPKNITAGTGMDAFAHCLEAYCSPSFHPMSQGIALEGMRLIKDNLFKVYEDGRNINSRGQMMIAATMGATAFQKGLGAIHSLSHPIGALYGLHHGTLNATIMPKVLTFNKKFIYDKIQLVSKYLEISGGFDGFLEFVTDLNKSLDIPSTITEFGIQEIDIEKVVADALLDPSTSSNPRLMDKANTKELLISCL
jgi:4-hydroxybutyrate dehydrogenase